MVAQTRGKTPMVHYFGWSVSDHVVDVNVQRLAIKVTVHMGVAPAMQGRIVKGQVQEQLCRYKNHNCAREGK